MKKEELLADLTPFGDIGSKPPHAVGKGAAITVQMTRDGRELKIAVDTDTGRVQLTKAGFPSKGFTSFPAMLSSDEFANLRHWAKTQAGSLASRIGEPKKLLPINGRTHKGDRVIDIASVSALIGAHRDRVDATEVLLIDGPAGIGKTHLVEQLALHRAANFSTSSGGLLLHVRSRGRVLSNLQDLMAFSLQSIRSTTTYDQIPVLARHGLVVVAIDGFDELGDPNGYELAWAQVNELMTAVRGKGTVILSGRDTFLGRDRLFRDVHALRKGIDAVTGLTMDPPSAAQAQAWLRTRQWDTVHLEAPAMAALLEDGSFALRPVFLTLFANNVKPRDVRSASDSFLTPLLVKHILQREAALFGDAVEAILTREGIENFLLCLLIELARDMADSESDAIDESSLAWIDEASLVDGLSDEVIRLVKNRANVLAFLKVDQRPNYRSFAHTHLQNYFLALATIQTIAAGEVPKYVRRNLLGAEFLSVFIDVAARVSGREQLNAFLARAVNASAIYSPIDRTTRNVGALLLASLHAMDAAYDIRDYEVDEAVVRGTAASAKLTNVKIHQLDCRGADLSQVQFEGCDIVNLIADDGSRFSYSIPIPRQLSVAGGDEPTSPDDIQEWLERRGRNAQSRVSTGIASPALLDHPMYQLLGRACRVRSYWLRAGDDIQANRVLADRYWPMLAAVLRECEMLREELRQASGSSSTFTHIRQRDRILAEDRNDQEIARLFARLEAEIEKAP